jgi:histidinol-phosphate aminotransferase
VFDNIIGEHIKKIVPYPPGKPIDELYREYGLKDVIKLASNENPLGPSPKAIEGIKNALSSLQRYPDGSSFYLKEAISSNLGVDKEEIVIGNGSNELIEFAVKAVACPGFEVISSFPSFLMYSKFVQVFGGKNVVIRLRDFTHDINEILKNITDRTKLIFLDNPNNPTGSVMSKALFADFMKKLPQDIIVVLDEAYMEFVKDGIDTVRGAELYRNDPRIIFIRTFSKVYGLAGLRLGYGVMDRELAGLLERVRQPFNINSLAQIAGVEALKDTAHLQKTLQTTWEGISYFEKELEEMGYNVYPSNTNFILIDIKRDAKTIYESMLKKGVIIRAMGAYDLKNFIRISIGLPSENQRCMDGLREALS